ncbi:hypothetical protein RIVM261_085800 [Rivularia sp. IAM M-261]|nr:hypothetical protein CAL7716_001790 [Calothrix sp. PCC 7716]GJD23624.1 hypothetical protein RIVM261_085800 [Rivularia sp. IAM M-261]
MMSERMMLKRNKTATSNLASLSLTSPTSPTLGNPTRGFGIQAAPHESSNQHSSQPDREQLPKEDVFKQHPVEPNISQISMRPQAKLTLSEAGSSPIFSNLVRNPGYVQRVESNSPKKPKKLYEDDINIIYNQFTKRTGKLKEIVWEKHLDAIADVCKKNKYTIAIRETGPLSIKRIAQGAKAKPHTILEKSIKESSLKKGYEDEAKDILKKLEKLDLDGFVGHWNEAGKLIGIRIDKIPRNIKRRFKLIVKERDRIAFVPLDLEKNDGGKAIRKLKITPDWKKYLYTGDYDLHEVYSHKGGGSGQIPEATPEKVKLLNQLNEGIQKSGEHSKMREGKAKLDDKTKTIHVSGDHAMFQHGDQATYRKNQHLEAKALEQDVAKVAKLVQAVATESDEPIAWCKNGNWFVTLNKQEHDIFRTKHGLKKPHTWTPKEDKRTKDGDKRTEQYHGHEKAKTRKKVN